MLKNMGWPRYEAIQLVHAVCAVDSECADVQNSHQLHLESTSKLKLHCQGTAYALSNECHSSPLTLYYAQ